MWFFLRKKYESRLLQFRFLGSFVAMNSQTLCAQYFSHALPTYIAVASFFAITNYSCYCLSIYMCSVTRSLFSNFERVCKEPSSPKIHFKVKLCFDTFHNCCLNTFQCEKNSNTPSQIPELLGQFVYRHLWDFRDKIRCQKSILFSHKWVLWFQKFTECRCIAYQSFIQ